MANLGDMVVRIVGDTTALNKSIDDAQHKFEKATSNFKKLGEGLTKYVTLPILGIGAAAVKAAADMEMQQAAFETMLGSAEKARDLLSDLNEMAAKTPFQLTDLADASKTMLAFGIANEKVLPNLQMLGDIAGGNAEKLRSLTLAFSQIQSTGRLMGQDLLQLVNAGFNPLQIISEKTGKTMAELKKEMEKGAISADMVSDAFKTATSEGGRFFGGMERASLTLNGLVSTLLDNFAMLGRSIGEVLLPTLKDFVKNVSSLVQRFTNLDDETKKNIIKWGLIAAAIGPVILGTLKLVETINTLRTVLNKFPVSANPYMLALAAIVAGALAVAAAIRRAKTEQENFNKTLDRTATQEQARAAIKAQQRTIEILEGNRIAALTDEQVAQYDKEISQAKQQLFLLNQRLRDIQTLAEVERQKSEAAAKADADEVARLEKQAALLQASINNQSELTSIISARTDALAANRNGFEEAADAQIEAEAEVSAAVDRGHAKKMAQIEEEKKARIEAYKYIYGQIDSIMDGIYANEIARIENSELSEEEKARKIAQIKRKQAIWDKAQAVADIAINTAVAVAKVLYRPLLAATVAALGAIQAGIALSTPLPPVPTFAEGGVVQPTPGGTLATVAEAGVAEAIIPLDRLEKMMGDTGGQTHLVVNLDSKPLLDTIFAATRDRRVLISAGAVV